MIWTMRDLVLSLHILFAMIWVGGILFVGWGVFPAVKAMHYPDQQQFLLAMMKHTHRLFTAAGAGVIGTGILLGTVFGPVRDSGVLFHSAYGHSFLLALMFGAITLSWGTFVSYRYSMKILSDQVLWKMAERGYDRVLKQSLRGVMLVTGVEVLGFLSLLAVMISF